MALFKKITPATSSQLEANSSQHITDPGSQCPWVPVTTRTASLDSGSEVLSGKKRYLCDLYSTIGMEKSTGWSSTIGGTQQPSSILPSLSFGKTETRMLREAYQKTSESLDVVQSRLRTVEQAILTLQTTMTRIAERQDELYDTLQDLAVMTATTQKKRRCVPSEETEERTVVEQTPPTAPASPPVMSQCVQSPLCEILSNSDMDALTVPPPPPPPPQQSSTSSVHSPHTEVFQSEWLEE